MTQCCEFRLRFGAVDEPCPLRMLREWAFAQQTVGATASVWQQTGPLPVLAALHHVGSKRIAFNVPQNSEVVIIRLHGKRLKPPLPDVTATVIMAVITAHVSCHQPLHPSTQVTVLMWP